MSIDYDLLIGQPPVGDPSRRPSGCRPLSVSPSRAGFLRGRAVGQRSPLRRQSGRRACDRGRRGLLGLLPAISVGLRNQCDGSEEEWMAAQAQLAITAVLLAVDLDADAVRLQNYEVVVMRGRAGRIELERGWKYCVDNGFADVVRRALEERDPGPRQPFSSSVHHRTRGRNRSVRKVVWSRSAAMTSRTVSPAIHSTSDRQPGVERLVVDGWTSLSRTALVVGGDG
jgi:hypothetical protein